MEHKAIFEGSNRNWSTSNGSNTLIDGFTVSNPMSFYSSYKPQIKEIVNQSYEYSKPLSELSSNSQDSSFFYTPWSTYGDEAVCSIQIPLKNNTERHEYGSDTDLYGLVSNILEEPDKSQACFAERGFSPNLKTVYNLNSNRLSDHQDIFPDSIKSNENSFVPPQSFCDIEFALAFGNQKIEDLCQGMTGLEQGEQCLYNCNNENYGFYNENSRLNFQEYQYSKNCYTPLNALTEAVKHTQNSTDMFLSQFDIHSSDGDLMRYATISGNRSKEGKYSILGLQDNMKSANGSTEMLMLDTENYGKKKEATQTCQKKPEDLIPDQHHFRKVVPLKSDNSFPKDSSFLSNLSPKSDYGRKVFHNNFERTHSRHDTQSSDFILSLPSLSGSNTVKLPLNNDQIENNPQTVYRNQDIMKANNHLTSSHKRSTNNPDCLKMLSSSSTNGSSNFNKKFYENPIFPMFEMSCRDDHVYACTLDKKPKPLNELYENLNDSDLNDSLACTNKQNISMKFQNTQYESKEKSLENCQDLLNSSFRFKNSMQGSGDNKSVISSRLSHPQSNCISHALLGDMQSNALNPLTFYGLRSPFSHALGHSVIPIMDCCDPLHYEDHVQLCPPCSDLTYSEVSFSGLGPLFNTQRSVRSRNSLASELHNRLEECYEQWRAMEKERKKTEAVLAKTYPGKKVSSTNNIPVPRLTANASRVDRLIVDQLREQAKVVTMLGKMERFRSSPLHANISTALDRHLEAIHIVQARRKEEIINVCNRQKKGGPLCQDDRDIYALATSIKEMSTATRKSRTAMWCGLQMTLPKISQASNIQS